MLIALFRILSGFVVACLGAAIVHLMFAFTPPGLAADPDWLERVLLTATHFAVFSVTFALLAAVLGEWLGWRGWLYYALAGLGIALSGFLVQHAGESAERTIWNAFALQAFLATGAAGGLIYWLVSGRRAGAEWEPAPPIATDVREEPMPDHFRLRQTVIGPPGVRSAGESPSEAKV